MIIPTINPIGCKDSRLHVRNLERHYLSFMRTIAGRGSGVWCTSHCLHAPIGQEQIKQD